MKRCLLSWLGLCLVVSASLVAQDPSTAPSATEDVPADVVSQESVSPETVALETVGEVKIELEPRQITVGDRVEAVVRLLWEGQEPTEPPRFPAWQESWGEAEVLDVGAVEAFVDQTGRYIYEQRLTLTAFRPGEVELPSLMIAVPTGEQTIEVALPGDGTFEVTSVLPQDAGEEAFEPRAPAALRQASIDQRFLIVIGVLVVLCGLAIWRLRRRLGEAGVAAILRPAVPRLDPLPELLDRLRQLEPGLGCEPVHTGLSFALRDYLGRRLAFSALESTTSEIQRLLRQSAVPIDVYQSTLKLLRSCDQVKFARLRVADATIHQRLATASELAGQIEQAMQPPEPAEEAA